MKSLTLIILLSLLPSRVVCGDILVVVNQDNATSELSKSQVIDIFLGRYVAFPDGKNAEPLDVSEESLKASFYQRLTRFNMARVNAYWSRIKFSGKARRPAELATERHAIDHLSEDAMAISYIHASSMTDELKVLYVVKGEDRAVLKDSEG